MNWKIKRDPFYNKLMEQYGEEFVVNAGYYPDSATEEFEIKDTIGIKCTPLNFMSAALKSAKKPCILLSTGSFAPIHSGHMAAMVNTKKKMEELGWDVVGGFFAPDHDEYISRKLKEQQIPIHERIEYIVDAIKEYDWLSVDCWPGLFHHYAINFTDIITRLEMYVEMHYGIKIPIIFVCGGDYARFADTFLNKGYCAVVNRPGYNTKVSDEAMATGRVFIVNNEDDNSSTSVRKNMTRKHKNRNVVLRLKSEADFRNERTAAIYKAITKRFDRVVPVTAESQAESIKDFPKNIITLDPLSSNIPKKFKLSRLYDYFGIKQLGFTSRPNIFSAPLEYQLKQLSLDVKGAVYLHDDDIHTGGTMVYAKKLLEDNGIEVAGFISYTRSEPNTETIDLRDFCAFEHDSGLVIKDIHTNMRLPYVYPYVCPYIRASIPDPLEFSIEIWEINIKHFEKSKVGFFGYNKAYLDICKENLDLLLSLKRSKDAQQKM